VVRVCAGDTQIFEILMRRYNQRLYRAARAILQSDADAEDAVQQAYLQAYRHLSQFEGRAKFSTWLTRIAVHERSSNPAMIMSSTLHPPLPTRNIKRTLPSWVRS
jgi:RNA polymerase sigma-70 factor (ECF subfamily)